MSKGKDTQAPTAVLEYLNKQNRPYSAIDIFTNLHKEYGKTAVVKALESLAENGKIKEKTYGKQKVYVADQSQYPDVDDNELKAMEQKISQFSEKLAALTSSNRALESELHSLNSALSTEEAQVELERIKGENASYKQKISTLKNNNNSISPEERKKIIVNRNKYVKEWRKRKRMAKDILDAILEGYPKPKKTLYEEIGLETDEEYKVSPPEL